MKDDKQQKRRGRPEADPREIGVIRVFSNPGPDAEERLRRLMTLMIKYATGNGQAEPEGDAAAREDDRYVPELPPQENEQ